MRRRIQLNIGILESILACVLFVVGWQLPRSESIEGSFERVGRVTYSAQTQVRLMREQVAEFRRTDFPRVTNHLRAQTRDFSARWRDSPLSFPTAETMNDTMSASAFSLEKWSATFDSNGLFRESTFLNRGPEQGDQRFARATMLTRAALEQSAIQLEQDCVALHTELGRPVDASALIKCVSTIGRIRNRIDRIDEAGGSDRLAELQETTAELESSLEIANRQVEAASTASFPLVIPNGASQPIVQLVPLWPEGKPAARQLGTTLAAVKAVNRHLNEFARATEVLRQGSADAHGSVGSLLNMARRMRGLASTLRRAQDGLDRSIAQWPDLVRTMRLSARILRTSHQIDELVGQRSEYDRAVHGGREATQTAEDLLQSYSSGLEARLSEQEQSLAQVESGLAEAGEAIPAVTRTTVDLLNAIRWMFWLVGALIALHGALVICESRLKTVYVSRSPEIAERET